MKHRWRGRTIIFVHHEGKSGLPRGTSKREDVLDTMIGLKHHDCDHEDESAFRLEFTKSRDFHGADAAPMIIYLSTASGTVEWRHESEKDSARERVKTMLDKGFKQSDIARELDLTRGRVSQIVKEMNAKAC
jgi:putative DNA primase/helicase